MKLFSDTFSPVKHSARGTVLDQVWKCRMTLLVAKRTWSHRKLQEIRIIALTEAG